jgi:hypothetical protein
LNADIQRLRAEIRSDRSAWSGRVDELRRLDMTHAEPGTLAQAAVALHHGYGALESAFERVARALEGSLPKGRDWQVASLDSMALEIEGVRPPVLSHESLRHLRSLLAFRHFFSPCLRGGARSAAARSLAQRHARAREPAREGSRRARRASGSGSC